MKLSLIVMLCGMSCCITDASRIRDFLERLGGVIGGRDGGDEVGGKTLVNTLYSQESNQLLPWLQ